MIKISRGHKDEVSFRRSYLKKLKNALEKEKNEESKKAKELNKK